MVELQAQVAQSHGRIAELEVQMAKLRAWIEQLERQAKEKTAENSSLPLEHTASSRPAAAA
jgi:regulator of replication initiation timing